MMEIGILFPYAFLIFAPGIQVNCLVDGIKSDGIMKQHENTNQMNFPENSGYPMSYDGETIYAKMSPLYYNNIMKRSAIDRSTGRRQTGIIYGDGKPIGILQPYEESFKFMPIREERVYSLDGGRSGVDQQEPYLNLMYPLARFARSEDALKMAEYEAARAEFLDKHYPSMLVDFKIRDKLHTNREKSTHHDIKRAGPKSNDVDELEQKRDSKISVNDRKTDKRDSQSVQKRENQLSSSGENRRSTQKRKVEKLQKRSAENARKRETDAAQKRENGNTQRDAKEGRKRDVEKPQKRESKSSTTFKKRQSESQKVANAVQNSSKKKRESGLTDDQFDKLKNVVSKRNSKENADMIEKDLKGLLSDMGLIEDDLEEDAEDLEQARSAVVEDEDSEEMFDNPVLSKEKIESSLERKRDYYGTSERKKRAQIESTESKAAEISFGLSGSDPGEEENVEKKRSNFNPSSNYKKRVIDVNLITRNRGNKLPPALNSELEEKFSKASVIPNKREASIAEVFGKRNQKISLEQEKVESNLPKVAFSTTETYAQYEERVAREIKNKIQQLKEEVKRELGALEEDNEDEDEDEESVGEPQRRKRFVVNTLLDEEAKNIDPNSDINNTELLPHVRRRRMLSTDMMDSNGDEKGSVNTREDSDLSNANAGQSATLNKGKFEYNSQDSQFENDNAQGETPSSRDKSMEENALKYIETNNNRFNFYKDVAYQIPYSNLRLTNQPTYFSRSRNYYTPYFQKRSFTNYIPWKIIDKSSNNLKSGVYSYDPEYEGNDGNGLNLKGESEDMPISDAGKSKKMQEWKYNPRALPRANKDHNVDRQSGYNQNYYVYYLGNNGDENVKYPLSSATDVRRIPMNNYQKMKMAYPQYYSNANQMRNKGHYRTASNDNENQKNLMFRLMYNMPPTRRKKRQVGRNFFVPFKNTEDAIVTSTFNRSTPYHGTGKTRMKNNTSSNANKYILSLGDIEQQKIVVSEDLKNQEYDRINANEMGKAVFSNDVSASDSKTYSPQVSPEGVFESYRDNGEILRNDYSDDLNEELDFDFAHKTVSTEPRYQHLQPVEENIHLINIPHPSSFNSTSELEKTNPEDIKVKSRKILFSSTVEKVDEMQCQGIETATHSYGDYSEQFSSKNDSSSPVGKSSGDKRINRTDNVTNGYEDVFHAPLSEIGTMEDSFKEKNGYEIVTQKTMRRIKSSEVLPNNISEKSVIKKITSDTKRAEIDIGIKNSNNINPSYLLASARTDIGKNNLYIRNEQFAHSDWKRRKRSIEEEAQQQKRLRQKRFDWFWPIKSSLEENIPQLDDYEQFDQNDSTDWDKQESERLRDSREGAGSNYEDFYTETGDFVREKRQPQNIQPVLSRINTVPYSRGRNLGRFGSYLPVSRRRRYSNGWYREPHRELLTDMSDQELFGALPQSYAGELNRYKRVKRDESAR